MDACARMAVCTVVALLGLTAPQTAAAEPVSGGLFGSDETLKVRIVAPLEVLRKERPEKDYVSGKFVFDTGNGATELDVGIRTRGNYRRRPDVCVFPPLRLNFKKSQVKGTLFANQDKLKLVTHCGNKSHTYGQAVISEFLAYRILNLMTDISFRVRLLEIQYETPDDGKQFEAYGILIEHRDALAERIGAAPLRTVKTEVEQLELEYLNLTSVYHFLIGNTDFSPIAGAVRGPCCHNHALFGNEGEPIYSVPYDFDMSGFVDAPYAAPNPKLRLDSVKERLYRGRCVNNDRLPATVNAFLEKREEIEDLISAQPQLATRNRADKLKYVAQFYKTISSERRLQRSVIRKCK